jgi:peptide/nickel transport system permease protein
MGIPIGILSAIRRNSFSSRASMFVAIVGVSLPVFWLGQLLLYVFWFRLGIMPSSGLEIGASIWESILQGKFILPWITVAVGYAAFYARMVRGNMIETMSDDYIRTARAKGLSERRVIFKHGLRGALTPVIGQLAVVSIGRNDFPMVMGVTVLGALFIAVANLCVDVAYAFLDPRVRYQ